MGNMWSDNDTSDSYFSDSVDIQHDWSSNWEGQSWFESVRDDAIEALAQSFDEDSDSD